jgi:hypothetical protein
MMIRIVFGQQLNGSIRNQGSVPVMISARAATAVNQSLGAAREGSGWVLTETLTYGSL